MQFFDFQIAFIKVDAVCRLRSQRKGDNRRMQLGRMVAVQCPFDVCLAPGGVVRRISAYAARITAAARIYGRLYDYIEAQTVATVQQRFRNGAGQQAQGRVSLAAQFAELPGIIVARNFAAAQGYFAAVNLHVSCAHLPGTVAVRLLRILLIAAVVQLFQLQPVGECHRIAPERIIGDAGQ